jgi:hypothetical protein
MQYAVIHSFFLMLMLNVIHSLDVAAKVCHYLLRITVSESLVADSDYINYRDIMIFSRSVDLT